MTRVQFMEKLDYYLKNVSYSEKTEIFRYYEEFFDELLLNDYDEIPKNMDPFKIAKDILLDLGLNDIKEKKKMTNPLKFILISLVAILSFPISFPLIIVIFLIVLFAFIFISLIPILLISFAAVLLSSPFSFLGNILSYATSTNNPFIIAGFVSLTIGIILLFVNVLVKIIRLILNVFANIFGFIYSKTKKKEEVNIMYTKIEDLKAINIKDFVGKINIKKSNENAYSLKNAFKDSAIITYNDSCLKVRFKNKKIINTNFYNLQELNIYYKEESFNLIIKDCVSNINAKLPSSGNFVFSDLVSTLNLTVNPFQEINLSISDNLTKLNIDKDILKSDNADTHISISDIVGSIRIRKE